MSNAVSMTPTAKMRIHIAFAALTGLMLRIYFVLKFPVTQSGDAPFYIELAWNWLKKGVYGFPVNGRLTAVDMRVPGYPAFLAAIFAFAGKSPRAVMLAQAVLDVAGCFLIALIAERLAPAESRRRVFIAGLWLAALCPFTANYPAVVLTETLVTFLTALAILVLLETDLGRRATNAAAMYAANGFFVNPWLLAGIVVGFGTLVRPETPLLLISAGLVLCGRWWRPKDWPKLARAGMLSGAGHGFAAFAVGCEKLESAAQSAISRAALQRIAGRVYATWIDRLDQHMDVALSRRVPGDLEGERRADLGG